MKKDRAICIISDRNYIFAIGAFINNLKMFNVKYDNIVIYCYGFNDNDKSIIHKADEKCIFVEYSKEDFFNEFRIDVKSSPKIEQFINRYSHLTYIKFKVLEQLENFKTVLLCDLDVVIRGDLDELFIFKEHIAWRNGNPFGMKFSPALRALKTTLDKIPELKGISSDFPTPNGGLVVANDTFNYSEGLALGREFTRKNIAYFSAGLDELCLAYVVFKLKLSLNKLDANIYNAFPHFCNTDTKIVHFMGPDKPWNNAFLQVVFHEWLSCYKKFCKINCYSSDKVKIFDNIGSAIINRVLLEDRWFSVLNKIALPAGLSLTYDFSTEVLVFKFNKFLQYEIKLMKWEFDSYFVGLRITNSKIKEQYYESIINEIINDNFLLENAGVVYSRKISSSKIQFFFDELWRISDKLRASTNENKEPTMNIRNLPINMEQCTGCTACTSICPKNAITMVEDAEGFLSPVINDALCVHCNLCKEVCPVLHPNKHPAPEMVQAAWIKDSAIRSQSSSGGLSTVLAQSVLADGGVVIGAVMDNFHVHHAIIETPDELYRIQSSKYVQSDMRDVYPQVKKILDSGRRVMFAGTPCQVAGLRNFLRKDHSLLLTVDLICHGVPSPGVLRRYVNELKETYYTATSCSFRDKVRNWNASHAFALYDDSGRQVFREPGNFNAYIRGFLSNVFNRSSCASCPFTSVKRTGDITIADFWKIGDYDTTLNDKKGTSLILLNTEKGSSAFKSVRDALAICKDVPISVAVVAQAQLRGPAKKSPLRKEFFQHYMHNGRIEAFLEKKLWRVGIFNFHFANNFGAVLVPFALSKTVEKLGYPSEIINFFGATPALNASFEEFRTKHFKRSKELRSKADLEAISPWWKRVVVGSDQVWRLMDTGIYMLNWAAGKKNLISYAASFGHDRYAGSISKAEAKALLGRFDAISVREASGVDICEKDFAVPAMHVLDPTLLLEADDYIDIINDEKPVISKHPYVCLAVLNPKNKEVLQGENKVLTDITQKYPLINALWDKGSFRTVAGWLETIRKSEYVIADSFHAVIFSIIFKKQFVCIVAKGVNGGDRIPSLLNTLHIDQCRIYNSLSDVSMKCFEKLINYDNVDIYLQKEKEKSINFLMTSLAKSPSPKDYFLKISNP